VSIEISILERVSSMLVCLVGIGLIIFGLAIIFSLPCYIAEEIAKFLERKLKERG